MLILERELLRVLTPRGIQRSMGKMFIRELKGVMLAGSLVLGLLTLASAQTTSGQIAWETLRPEAEEFSVLLPKGSTFESGQELYHKMELKSRLYLSQTQGGPVFAVVSLSGIKSNPAMYTEMQRVNSYVDAFKQIFSAKIRTTKTPVAAKLTLVGPKELFGNAGREYRMTLGDLSGTVNVFATRRRFYALVYLNTKKDDDIQNQFLSSFVLPEFIPKPPEPVAVQTPANTTEEKKGGAQAAPDAPGTEAVANTANAAEPKLEEAEHAPTPSDKRRPVSGGVLNGKALVLPKPEHPANARDVAGQVAIRVTVDEMGNVIEAKAVSGHQLFHQASVNAAMQAKFSPTLLMGEPVKVNGLIVYNFVKQ
jgi:hypothetical protein